VRIAFVLPSLTAGGAERVVSRLADHWVERGHDVHLLLLAGPEHRPYYPLAPAVRLHALDLLRPSRGPLDALVATLRRLHRLRRIMANEAPDAVLAFLPEIGALATLAAFGTGIPVIVSERASPIDQPLPAAWRPLRRLAYESAAAVVFQTERAGTAFPPSVQARGCVIPNPVDLPANPAADPAALEIVAAGRLVPQKGFDLLVGAFAAVADQHPGWRLTIWGEGPERDRLTALAARHGLGGRVRLPGTSQAPGGWLPGSSIFALPSRFEGFPNALCEAMGAGYAAIAADCRFGPREIVRDGRDGLLVPPENERALADALAALMGSVERRRQMGAAARQAVRRYELPAVARRWEALVERVALRGAVPAGVRP
jgi:glycosyltransferase involved in cell wall biosynthesis